MLYMGKLKVDVQILSIFSYSSIKIYLKITNDKCTQIYKYLFKKTEPRFCFHVAEFVMCRQPHQKSGSKQPRNITYMPHSTESFLARAPSPAHTAFCLSNTASDCNYSKISLEGSL